MTVEDQLRAAGRAVRDQVRDLPELDLRRAPAVRRHRARGGRRRPGAGRWLIPMAAAVSVVAVAVTLVAVKAPPRVTPKFSAGPSPSAGPAVTAAPVDPEALPDYFVAIKDLEVIGQLPPPGKSGPPKAPKPDSVIVGETLTGKRVATIAPPAGSTFAGVTGAADDRTFVLDSVKLTEGLRGSGSLQATQPRTWYLLRIRPGATPVQALTPLHFPLPVGADVDGIALSPDGTRLAALYQVARSGDGFPYSGAFTLGIYSVATGAVLRSWTGTDPAHGSYAYAGDSPPDTNANLTWTSDGQRLAFVYENSNSPVNGLYLREVNLAGPGGDLFTASKVIATIGLSTASARSRPWCESLGITGDGRSAICGASMPKTLPPGATLDALTESADPWRGCAAATDAVWPGLVRISLTGGRLARVLYEAEPRCLDGGLANVLWSSPSGDTVLGTVSYATGPSTGYSAIVLYRHGTVTTLSWPGAVSMLLAGRTAF